MELIPILIAVAIKIMLLRRTCTPIRRFAPSFKKVRYGR
jgi:hypothetical protein